jgi:hypothetical protein
MAPNMTREPGVTTKKDKKGSAGTLPFSSERED